MDNKEEILEKLQELSELLPPGLRIVLTEPTKEMILASKLAKESTDDGRPE